MDEQERGNSPLESRNETKKTEESSQPAIGACTGSTAPDPTFTITAGDARALLSLVNRTPINGQEAEGVVTLKRKLTVIANSQ